MTYDPKSNSVQAAALMLCVEPKELTDKLNDQNQATVWRSIETVPLREDVICLWATCTVGHTVFYSDHDVKHTYARYWMPLPKVPTQ